MLLSDWRVLTRRWYVLVVGIAATVALCWAATVVVHAKYEVTANVLMLPPRTTAKDTVANPYLNLGGLEGIADVVSKTMTDRSTGEGLKAGGFATDYTMMRDQSSAGPVILITVDGASEQQSLATLKALLDRIPATLSRAQTASGVGETAMITSTVITRDSDALVIRKSQIRGLVVATAGGLGATFLAAAVLDGLLLSRPRRGQLGRQLVPPAATSGPVGNLDPHAGMRPTDRDWMALGASRNEPANPTRDGGGSA